MAWVAHQRAAARILPEHLTALEWCWNGTLFRGERPVEAGALARHLRNRKVYSCWLWLATVGGAFTLFAAQGYHFDPLFCLSSAALTGIPAGLLFRRILTTCTGFRDYRAARTIGPSLMRTPLRIQIANVLSETGGWAVWGTLALATGVSVILCR
jgi:hypothetical protein